MAEKVYLVNQETGSRHRIGGFIPSDPNQPSEFPNFGSQRTFSDAQLPASVDLREFMTPVEDQGDCDSCVGNALAGAYEFLIKKNTGKHIDVSRLFIYYNARRKQGMSEYTIQDRGTRITTAIDGLKEFGCCKEDIFPYDLNYVNEKPPPKCYDEAKNYRIIEGMSIQTKLNEMKACLAEGYPFAFGLQLFASVSEAENNGGFVPMPQPDESGAQQHRWHAMLAVGYIDSQRLFIIRNSWGSNWGDKGYGYIPYEYMSNPQRCLDLHTIKTITERRRKTSQQVSRNNTWDWTSNQDVSYVPLDDYSYDPTVDWTSNQDVSYVPPDDCSYDPTWFWKSDDLDQFFVPERVASLELNRRSNTHSNRQVGRIETIKAGTSSSGKFYILWIDQRNDENQRFLELFKKEFDVQMDFARTFADGLEHVLRNKEKIQSSSRFLIICRGYYPKENKNPLNLLQFLNQQQLKNVPVIVFTQDKAGLLHHFEKDAFNLRVLDWEKRLQILTSPDHLIAAVKQHVHR